MASERPAANWSDPQHLSWVFRSRTPGRGHHVFRFECNCGRKGNWVPTELETWPERVMHLNAARLLAAAARRVA